MDRLQGVAIPRCYGYFETVVPIGSSIEEALRRLAQRYYNEEDGEDNLILAKDRLVGLHELVEERCQRRDIIAVPVLEKLGPRLSPSQEITRKTKQVLALLFQTIRSHLTFRKDLESVFEDLAHLCIDSQSRVGYLFIIA